MILLMVNGPGGVIVFGRTYWWDLRLAEELRTNYGAM